MPTRVGPAAPISAIRGSLPLEDPAGTPAEIRAVPLAAALGRHSPGCEWNELLTGIADIQPKSTTPFELRANGGEEEGEQLPDVRCWWWRWCWQRVVQVF